MTLFLWPTPPQEALLRAALGTGEQALAAFASWTDQCDPTQDLDGASYRLLPLLYANLTGIGCDDPLLRRLSGVYRRSWCEAQIRQTRLVRMLAVLQDAGISVMASKGIVLALQYYPSPGMRPMSDVDLVVPRARALEALDRLQAAGWAMPAAVSRHWRGRRDDMLALVSGVNLNHADGGELDVQWRLVHECVSEAADRRFWAAALPFEVGERQLLRPSPADLLFHVVVHGLRPNELSPIRWIADAAMILRRDAAAIDWDELLDFADRMRLRHRLGLGLRYLKRTIGLDLPDPALRTTDVRPHWIERLDARADAALLSGRSARGKTGLPFLAFLLRFMISDGRSVLPRLVLNWFALKLRSLREREVSAV